MAVTREQIFEAADQIAAAGQRPTLEAVRQITGGSYTTISPALNEWKTKQASAATPMREPAPQAVAERLAELGAEVWAIALELANGRLAAEREALEKARADMESAQAEATGLADKLADEVEVLQSRLASVEAAEVAARREVEELREKLVAERERTRTSEARTQEIEHRAADLRVELDLAHQDALQLRAERDKAQTEVIQVREEAARLAGQLQAHQEQTAAILARLTDVKRTTSRGKSGSGQGGG